MSSVIQSIAGWFRRFVGPKEPELSEEESERLSALFRERYHSFRVLLAANGRALETMAAMEQAWAGTQPYGMDFVVSNATTAGVRVYRMIRHLDALAPDKYTGLFQRFDEIRGEMDATLREQPPTINAPFVLPLQAIGRDDSAVVGAKMANLGEIRNVLGIEVPPGFVITAAAYNRVLDHNDLRPEIHRLIQNVEIDRPDALFALSSQLQQLIATAEVPSDVCKAVADALTEVRGGLDSETGFAVRSSASGEDTAETSFAGLYESQLNVRPENLRNGCQQVHAAGHGLSAPARASRRGH